MTRLKPEECKKLAHHAGNLILNDPSVTLKSTRAKVLEAIERTLVQHFEEERQIDLQTEKLYGQQAEAIGKHEKGKAMAMIRRQLAQEKDFVLSGSPDGARFSEDKISHIAHLVGDKLFDDDLLDFKDEDEGPQYLKRVFTKYFNQETQINEKVRKKIMSQANAPFEGSRDWDVLFRKYYEEEMRRLDHS